MPNEDVHHVHSCSLCPQPVLEPPITNFAIAVIDSPVDSCPKPTNINNHRYRYRTSTLELPVWPRQSIVDNRVSRLRKKVIYQSITGFETASSTLSLTSHGRFMMGQPNELWVYLSQIDGPTHGS